MNEIVKKFSLAGDKFIPEMLIRQPRYTTVPAAHLTKTKKEYKNLKKLKI